jgi:hypothetical protein
MVDDDDDVCDDVEVTWVCEGNHDQDLFRDNCKEAMTSGRLRYCCSDSFLAECR